MGFGILFFGYFMAMLIFLGAFSVCRAIGSALMAWAAVKLRRYHRMFDLLLWMSLISVLFYGIRAISDIPLWLTGKALFPDAVINIFSVIDIPLTFLFHVCMLMGIHAIAKETGVEKAVLAAIRNLVFYVLVLILQLLSFIPTVVTRNLDVVAMILSFVLSVLNLILIFRCYAKICDSEDTEMEQKKSRFTFVNRYREELERKNQKAMAAEMEYRREKKERRERRKNGKK